MQQKQSEHACGDDIQPKNAGVFDMNYLGQNQIELAS